MAQRLVVFLTLLEPVMILLMDGVMLMIVLAMLLPILSSATWTPLEIKGLQVLFSDR